jgi:hypothetical protein
VIKEVPEWVEKERAARIARERAISLAGKLKIEEVPIPDPQQPSPPPEIQEEKIEARA